MMNKTTGRPASSIGLLTAAVVLLASVAQAATISVNMSNSPGTDLASIDVAGVVPVDNWNNIFVGLTATTPPVMVGPTALVDSTGSATTATFEATLGSSYVGDSGAGTSDANRTMMQGYASWDLVDGTAPEDTGNMEIAGLGSEFTALGYSVYIYADTDTNDRTYSITVGGSTGTVVDSATFSGTFVAGSGTDDNYVVFSGLTSSSFTVDMDSNSGRGAVNGIQIVSAIPEPNAFMLAVLAMGSVLGLRKRNS